jgi:hypothetical protein
MAIEKQVEYKFCPIPQRSGKALIPIYSGTVNKQEKRLATCSECIAKMANLSQYCTSFMPGG